MKAYSFYFNTSDWLASPAVKMMSKAERGVYIGLLASAWESPVQGTLPASEDKVRRLAEMSLDEWAESGETLLEKFPLSECGTYRYNPRLLTEATKEQARSDKAKKSADMRWQSERNANASKSDANAPEKPCVRNAQVKVSKEPTNVGGKEATDLLALQAEKTKQEMVAARTDPDDLQGVDESPLVKPAAFAAILQATGYPNLDAERYRLQIAAKSEGVRRTSSQWRSRIIEFVNNDYTAGKLLTHPVLTPNEIPGNWDTARQGAYTAPMGQGIPHPSSYLKPDFIHSC